MEEFNCLTMKLAARGYFPTLAIIRRIEGENAIYVWQCRLHHAGRGVPNGEGSDALAAVKAAVENLESMTRG